MNYSTIGRIEFFVVSHFVGDADLADIIESGSSWSWEQNAQKYVISQFFKGRFSCKLLVEIS